MSINRSWPRLNAKNRYRSYQDVPNCSRSLLSGPNNILEPAACSDGNMRTKIVIWTIDDRWWDMFFASPLYPDSDHAMQDNALGRYWIDPGDAGRNEHLFLQEMNMPWPGQHCGIYMKSRRLQVSDQNILVSGWRKSSRHYKLVAGSETVSERLGMCTLRTLPLDMTLLFTILASS